MVLRIKWRLLTGFEAVCATTANVMLLHVLNAKLVKVPNSLRVRGLSLWLRNFDWIAQYFPCRVHAIRSMPSSRDGRLSRLRTSGGTSRSSPDVPKFSLIFRRSLQIELRQALKHSTLFAICWKPFGALPKVAPRGAGGNKPILRKHLQHPC